MHVPDDRSILVIDDHPLFRIALTTAVRRLWGSVNVVEAATMRDGLALLDRHVIHLVLLDLRLPDLDEETSGLMSLRARHPQVPVVVITALEGRGVRDQAQRLGAVGFIPKCASIQEISEALSAVESTSWQRHGTDRKTSAEQDRGGARLRTLTPTQARILVQLKEGRLNKQIAYDLSISEATVKGHMTEIFRKLGVRNRTHAVIATQGLTGVKHG